MRKTWGKSRKNWGKVGESWTKIWKFSENLIFFPKICFFLSRKSLRVCLLITLIKCLKGHKYLGSLYNVKSKSTLSDSVTEWQGHLLSCSGQLKKEMFEAFSNRRGNKGGLQNKEALLDEFFLESFPALLRLLRTVRYTFFWLSIFINLKDMKRKISIL